MDEEQAVESRSYEPPLITEVGDLAEVTQGQYSRNRSDDGDAGGYFPG
ncbi:lasso RiPP family leader peptide-containing protein [Amycolatopsis sp. NPDC004378]